MPDRPVPLDELTERLTPLPSERVVVSALLAEREEGWALSHASLILGPPAMGQLSWADWGRRELAAEARLWPAGLPPTFALPHGGLLAVRQTVTLTQAARWLERTLTDGANPTLGDVPAAKAELRPSRAPALARPRNETPASRFVLGTARPVVGFLFPLDEAPAVETPERWPIDTQDVLTHQLLGIAVPTAAPGTHSQSAPPGVFLGRLSRRAWLARVAYRREEELLHVWLRLESKRADPHELELEVEEHIEGDLADCRRLRLADLRLPARVQGRLGVRLPTLGRGIERTVRLYHRDGELLDELVAFNLVERMEGRLTANGSATATVVAGETRPPADVGERLDDIRRVEEQYRSWLGRGAQRRLVAGRDARDELKRRLQRASDELLIIDPFFGGDKADWELLHAVKAPVRVLTGWRTKSPSVRRPHVEARMWTRDPIPFHDRFYLWGSDSGINVGASANGLSGARLFRIDELSGAEVRALRERFEAWWHSSHVRRV